MIKEELNNLETKAIRLLKEIHYVGSSSENVTGVMNAKQDEYCSQLIPIWHRLLEIRNLETIVRYHGLKDPKKANANKTYSLKVGYILEDIALLLDHGPDFGPKSLEAMKNYLVERGRIDG